MKVEPSITRQKIIGEAKRRGWRVTYFDPAERVYEIVTAAGQRCFFIGSAPQKTSWVATKIADHKSLSYHYLQSLGIKVPPFLDYEDEASAKAFLDKHKPIVVKPEDSYKSRGVSVGVTTLTQLRKAVREARKYSEFVILQQQLSGKLYRLLVLDGIFSAAAHRQAAAVTGDGVHTVRELIVRKNNGPLRSGENVTPLAKIDIRLAEKFLGLRALDAVPSMAETVKVAPIDSLMAGGEAADVTDVVHPSYVAIAEQIAQGLGLLAAGLDIITPDITRPFEADGVFPFLEINARPGFTMHYHPTAGGRPRNPAAALLDAVFGKD